MNLSENFRIALRALSANKMRSILTMLGIIIGVGAVVALMAIGQGATASITSQVEGIGSNQITVFPGRLQRGPDSGAIQPAVLYLDDYAALKRDLKNITAIVPSIETNAMVTYEKETSNVQVTATTPDYLPVNAYELARGQNFTAADVQRATRVAVIGSETATNLFSGLNPVGRKIKIGGVSFEVVGVLAEKGSGGFGNADDLILIPLETGYDRLESGTLVRSGQKTVTGIAFSAASAEVVDQVMIDAERILRREHGLRPTEESDFTLFSQTQLLSSLSTITATLTIFLGAIAGISLLVGGIGIMNIMLVSVTERTKEIGLRKAVGAKRSVILTQFLVETLLLSMTGGLLGVLLGWGIAAAVTAANLITAQVTWDSIALAFGFSAAVGLFFGIYPAWRASRLRPIEALRYE
jgi:putative ABC transport system permease protein